MPMKLKRWAIAIAQPYFLNKPTICFDTNIMDPHNAQMNYEQPDFMDIDAEFDSKKPGKQFFCSSI